HGGSGACTAASQQEGHGFDFHMGRCWLWGAGPPQTFSAQVGTFCVEFACSPRVHKGFPPLRPATEKHAKRAEHSCPSLTETDGSLGPWALTSCPLHLEGRSRMGKRQRIISPRPQPCVCVCVSCVASIYALV